MDASDSIPVAGVRGLEHTADVGLEVEAPDLPELFRRGALGAMWLVLERPAGRAWGILPANESPSDSGRELPPEGARGTEAMDTGEEERVVHLVEEDLPGLFRSWLRTVLLWEEMEDFVTVEARLKLLPTPLCQAPDGEAFALEGRVRGIRDPGPRIREIKGVTLHGLDLERHPGGWLGTVIFDV
jgi:SHS2 domain-containing protein